MIKMKKRNLVILLLIVVLTGTVFISGCGHHVAPKPSSGSTSGKVSGLPAYPGSKESKEYSIWTKLTGFSNRYSEIHGYVVKNASPSDIVDWYKSKFPAYKVDDEKTINIQGKGIASLALKKGNTTIGVIAFAQGNQTVYFVGKVISQESEEEGAALPNHDIASGEEPVSRYPGSVMLSYSKDGTFPVYYHIKYGTKDAHDKVADWFKNTLPSQGWKITGQGGTTEGNVTSLEFGKDDDEATIYIYAPTPDLAYTTIEARYTIRRNLPDHDLVTGTDPIERYPKSVIIKYNKGSISYQGQSTNGVEVEYLAPAKLDDVKKWYADKLKAMSFNIMGGSEAGSAGLFAMGKSNGHSVIIMIDFEKHIKYTKVSLRYITQS